MAGKKNKKTPTRKSTRSYSKSAKKVASKGIKRAAARSKKTMMKFKKMPHRAAPRGTQNISKNPIDVQARVLALAKKGGLPFEKRKASKHKRVKKYLKKVEKFTHNMIAETANAVDKYQNWAESVAPAITGLAATQPENPLLLAAAGMVDSATFMKESGLTNLIRQTVGAADQGKDIKQVGAYQNNGKYLRMVADMQDNLPVYGPSIEDIDGIPDEDDL